ncbi:MAG: Na/Pi cotransporter family protein, partial [Geminicoccaceae bacterium]
MPVTHAIIDILGEVALLLWGLHMVSSGVQRAFGADLRHFLRRALRHRLTALAAGLLATLVLQSSTATALIAGSLSASGAIAPVPGLAVMLG